MKKIVVAAILFLSMHAFGIASEKENPAAAEMSVSVKGTVVDKNNGEVLAGVAVKIVGSSIVVYSDFDGNFQISNLKPGKYQIESDMISYKKNRKEVKIEIVQNSKLELEMENL
ncbi:MAG: carboxypeptidase-like regulatory domain-containing protein [Bacteroidales bacterium]